MESMDSILISMIFPAICAGCATSVLFQVNHATPSARKSCLRNGNGRSIEVLDCWKSRLGHSCHCALPPDAPLHCPTTRPPPDPLQMRALPVRINPARAPASISSENRSRLTQFHSQPHHCSSPIFPPPHVPPTFTPTVRPAPSDLAAAAPVPPSETLSSDG
jgi:hypothetical protein